MYHFEQFLLIFERSVDSTFVIVRALQNSNRLCKPIYACKEFSFFPFR